MATLVGLVGGYALPALAGPIVELPLQLQLPQVTDTRAVTLADVLAPMPSTATSKKTIAQCAAGKDLAKAKDLAPAMLVVSRSEIRYAGQPQVVLSEGKVVASAHLGELVPVVKETLEGVLQAARVAEEQGCSLPVLGGDLGAPVLLMAVDERVPYETIARLVFSGAEAGFGHFALVVDGPDSGAPWIAARAVEDAAAPAPALTVAAQGMQLATAEEPTVWPCTSGKRCGDVDAYDWDALAAALDGAGGGTSLIVVPDRALPVAALARVLSVATGGASPRVSSPLLAGGEEGAERVGVKIAEQTPAQKALTYDEPLAVLGFGLALVAVEEPAP